MKKYRASVTIPIEIEYGYVDNDYIEADSIEEAESKAIESAMSDVTIIGADCSLETATAMVFEVDDEDEVDGEGTENE